MNLPYKETQDVQYPNSMSLFAYFPFLRQSMIMVSVCHFHVRSTSYLLTAHNKQNNMADTNLRGGSDTSAT